MSYRPIPRTIAALTCGLLIAAFPAAAQKGAAAVRGSVSDQSQQPIANASVYLIPAADIQALAAQAADRRKNSPNDEPLEDSLAANRAKYAKATTDAKGAFAIPKVGSGRYFVYVEPSGGEYLPGGTLANKSLSAAELARKPLAIKVSGRTPGDATFVGSSACLGCHADYSSIGKTMHKLGIRVVDKPGKLQDDSRFPAMNAGLKKLQAGATFYFSGYDKARGFDKYLVSAKAPADASSVSFTATFFKDADGKLKFRTKNARNPADPERTYTVEATYGGGVYKQRYLFRAGGSLYPFMQFNAEGNDAHKDRTRKVWRDYHADWLYDEPAGKLIDPPKAKAFDKECASCHYTGYSLTKTAAGEYKAGAVNDPHGEMDIDGDGVPNELNIGCEVCHGPGSAHVKAPAEKKAATIVNPAKLAAERSTTICVQCHSRPQGSLKNDQPVDKDNRMLTPGTSRNEYLVSYTTREDAASRDYWPGGAYSKSHHQQGTDMVSSRHYANGRQLVTCANCHDPHGRTENRHQVKVAARDAGNSLCASCHKDVKIKAHTAQRVGFEHAMKIACVDCHMPKTMQTGSGRVASTTGDGAVYWANDITSHAFGVPRKVNMAVQGVDPGKAMPIPYTQGCGASCHDLKTLK